MSYIHSLSKCHFQSWEQLMHRQREREREGGGVQIQTLQFFTIIRGKKQWWVSRTYKVKSQEKLYMYSWQCAATTQMAQKYKTKCWLRKCNTTANVDFEHIQLLLTDTTKQQNSIYNSHSTCNYLLFFSKTQNRNCANLLCSVCQSSGISLYWL